MADQLQGLPPKSAASVSLLDIAAVFLKLGTIGFGGPAAHITLIEEDVVGRRRWLSRGTFLDYLGATNLIPGPHSTELAIHVGQACRGWRGLLVAGSCFILPATIIVGVLAWVYVRFAAVPAAAGMLYGVKPVVIVIVLQALWRLGRTALKTPPLALFGLAAAAAAFLGVWSRWQRVARSRPGLDDGRTNGRPARPQPRSRCPAEEPVRRSRGSRTSTS
jgi:chromate transporter